MQFYKPIIKMSVFNSTNTDYVFLWNTGSKSVTLYAGNETAIAPQNGQPAIMIRFVAEMPILIVGYIHSGMCVKIKMQQGTDGFMELISVQQFYEAYKQGNPRHVFKQIVPR